jgi:hypothetical protein
MEKENPGAVGTDRDLIAGADPLRLSGLLYASLRRLAAFEAGPDRCARA